MNDINWLHAIHYYCDRLLELWPGKVALGTALAAILTALGIDHVLFGVLLASVMGEMLTRIIVHCKRGKSLCRGLHHGLRVCGCRAAAPVWKKRWRMPWKAAAPVPPTGTTSRLPSTPDSPWTTFLWIRPKLPTGSRVPVRHPVPAPPAGTMP